MTLKFFLYHPRSSTHILIAMFIFSHFYLRPIETYSFPQLASGENNRSTFSKNSLAPKDSATVIQPVSEPKPELKWYTMFQKLPGDVATYGRLSIQKNKLPEFAVVSALTAILIVTDDATYQPSKRFYYSSSRAKNWSDFFSEVGDGRTQFGLSGAYALYGFIARDTRALRTASQIVEAVLSSGAVVQVLKHITGRESPFVATRPTGAWDFFPNQIEYHKHVPRYDAFPSGHVTTSLATVIVIAENYPEVKWVKPVGYIMVGLIGIGMANRGIHWYSDYPLGITMGYTFGMIVSHPERYLSNRNKDQSTKISLGPVLAPDRLGAELVLSF